MAVLRSELHNVQKIMVEDIGEKKEQQLADLRTNNEKLKEELVQLKSESTSKLSSLTQKVQEVEDEKEDLKEKFYCADAQSESLKANTVISKNLKKKNVQFVWQTYPLFIHKSFVLNEMFKRRTSTFAIFNVHEN